MLISHKHKFITIDIPKTGTRTLRESLQPLGIIDVVGQPKWKNFYQHGSINDCELGFKDRGWDFENYFKFSVVRNPWDRYFSFLTYYKMKADEYSEEIEYPNELDKKQGEMAVDLFKGRSYAEVLKTLIQNRPPHSYFLLNEDNSCEFNRITLFEDLNRGFEEFCLDVGVTAPPLMHSNKSSASITKEEVYRQELIDMVAEKEKWVIDKFNYKYP